MQKAMERARLGASRGKIKVGEGSKQDIRREENKIEGASSSFASHGRLGKEQSISIREARAILESR